MWRLGAEPLRSADRMTSYAISYQSEAKFGLRDCNLSSMYSQSFQKCCMCSVAARANFQCRTLTHCKFKLFLSQAFGDDLFTGKSPLIPLGGDYISGLCLRTSSTICLWQFHVLQGLFGGGHLQIA